ncbi:MAG: Gfo/Idh/MocA family oxidoreductase [Rhodothermales bacterium]
MRKVGIIMNGVTGRMGRNQHLKRSILPIIEQGGLLVGDERIVPEPVLVGRSAEKLKRLAEETGIEAYTTQLDDVLSDDRYDIYFDAQVTDVRFESVRKAIRAGKHIYCEKPTALTTDDAVELYRTAEERGVKHGVVQDKLWLPGLMKLRELRDCNFFGRILSVRGDFGYWVFDGDRVSAQRPSWNYRAEDGGGIMLDMFCHWRYVLDNLFGRVTSLAALATTNVTRRWDEAGEPYEATADDAAYAIFRLGNGVVAQFNSSWTVRVRRDDLLTIQVDGTEGSAVSGLRQCRIQPGVATPKPVWNPDVDQKHLFYDDWMLLPERDATANAFKAQWELFLRHVAADEPFRWNLLEGAKGVQLAELGYEASHQRTWVDVPPLIVSTDAPAES